MKPDWDKLMEAFKDSKTTLIADVDCTTAGKKLCEQVGVKSYPTIKHGDPNNLEDYKGERDFDALKKFADESLGATCGPANVHLCDAEQKKMIEEFQGMSIAKLEVAIAEKTVAISKQEADLKALLESLQKQYSDASDKKDEEVEVIENSGLRLMKAVKAHAKRASKSEL